jgi:hypothetical protein
MKRLIITLILIAFISPGLFSAKIHKVGGVPKFVTVANTRYTISEFENASGSDTLGRGSAYANIEDAVSALDGHGGIIQVENETAVYDNLTIPANVRLILPPTAAFAVASGKTLTVNCQVEGVVRNTGSGSLAYGTSYAVMTPMPTGKHELYVDGSRTDTFTSDGSRERPYSTVLLATAAINTDVLAHGTAGTGDAANYVIHVGAGTYTGNLTITGPRYLRIEGSGVVISGTILINSGVGAYDHIEFVGQETGFSEKGPAMTLSGAITCTRTNDSLIYVSFKGCLVSGTLDTDTDGTWVIQFDGCRVNGAITGTFSVAGHAAILLVTHGWNEFAGAISGKLAFYDVNGSDFYGAIITTPYYASKFKDCSFSSTVSIVPATPSDSAVQSLDLVSYKSLLARTPTLTGASISILETYGAGVVAATGNKVLDTNSGSLHTSVFTLSSVALTLTAAGAGVGFGNVKLYDFPEGYIYVIGAVADLTITSADADLADNWDGDIALGTTADDNGTLASTEVNIIPATSTPQAAAKATTGDGVSTATEHAIVDGHTSAFDLYINLLADAADIADASTAPVAISGTITITWINLGDN